MGGHDAGVSLGPVLELPAFPRAAVVGPFATRIRGSTTEVQLAPVLVIRRVLPLMAFGVPSAGWQEHVVGAQIGGFSVEDRRRPLLSASGRPARNNVTQ